MARAIRSCVHKGCMARREKKIFRETDEFCPYCGNRLGYVCRRCWRPLKDGNSRYCPMCLTKQKNERDELLEKLSQTAKSVSKTAGETLTETLTTTGKLVSEGLEVVKQVSQVSAERLDQTLDEMKEREAERREREETLVLPEQYHRIETNNAEHAETYTFINRETKGIVMILPVAKGEELSHDWLSVICDLREEMDNDSGLIEISTGTTLKKRDYIYHLIKHRVPGERGETVRIQYTVTLQIQMKQQTMLILGRFDEAGNTGERERITFQMLKNLGKIPEDFNLDTDWYKDPYNPNWNYGFLMNMSEEKTFDKHFPEHPLSVARDLVLSVRDLD